MKPRLHNPKSYTTKMADDVKPRLESAMNKLLSITEKSGNLRKDLKRTS